jgi:hypothetical protein
MELKREEDLNCDDNEDLEREKKGFCSKNENKRVRA